MLDHVEARCQLEAVVGEGHLEHRSGYDLARASLACQCDARLGQLDACDLAIAGQLDHVAPAAAAGVEDACTRAEPEARDDPVEHRAPSSVPPVPVLGLVGLQLVVPIHAGSILS
jgi:hypothetical protein